MNRDEWYIYWRESRLSRPKTNIGPALNKALKRIYGIHLESKDLVKFELIEKYENRISERLKKDYLELKIKGEMAASELFKSLTYSDNPFLKMLKPDNFSGSYYPIPKVK